MSEVMDMGRVSGAQPASFSVHQVADVGLSPGQRRLIDLLKLRINQSQPITRDDITSLWFDVCRPDRIKFVRNDQFDPILRRWVNYGYNKVAVGLDDPWARNCSRQWFLTNLGNCIVKGRLLAIPVIEMESAGERVSGPEPLVPKGRSDSDGVGARPERSEGDAQNQDR